MTAALPTVVGQPGSSTDTLAPSARDHLYVGLLAVLAAACWVPFLGSSLSPDEAGYLMVAGQWHDGSSLYGDYWVDRPPGLIALFALADAAGGAIAVRLLGLAAIVTSVLLAGALGRHRGGRRGALLAAGAAAVLLATPLTGAGAVNGELLGLPFVLGGVLALLRARDAERTGQVLAWAASAGAAGAAAILVKQSLLDVAVLAVVLLGADLLGRRRPGSRLRLALVTGVIAAAAVGALAVAAAAARGTAPSALWDAVVTFRGEAAGVIVDSASASTPARLGRVLLALLGTGAPLLVLALIRTARADRGVDRGDRGADRMSGAQLRTAAWALLAWELVVVLIGGSYWLHYLVGLVPGVVLLAASVPATGPLPGRRLLRTAYGLGVASLVVALAVVAVRPFHGPEEQARSWLAEHARPGQTGLVAFGAPNVLQAAGLSSPYPDLWSLPVRVRDPELTRLVALLESPRRPDWLVVSGRSVSTWGVDGSRADALVAEHYEQATVAGMYTVFRRTEQP